MNRSIVGSMTEFAHLADAYRAEESDPTSLDFDPVGSGRPDRIYTRPCIGQARIGCNFMALAVGRSPKSTLGLSVHTDQFADGIKVQAWGEGMANAEQEAILRQGAFVWNRWRLEGGPHIPTSTESMVGGRGRGTLV